MEQSGEILLKIAPPVMFAQLIQVLYNIIDSFFIGKYSANALTALTVVCPLQLVIIALSVGTGVGVNTYMAAAWATVCGQAVSAMNTGIKGFRRPPELGLAGADHRAVLKKRGSTHHWKCCVSDYWNQFLLRGFSLMLPVYFQALGDGKTSLLLMEYLWYVVAAYPYRNGNRAYRSVGSGGNCRQQ